VIRQYIARPRRQFRLDSCSPVSLDLAIFYFLPFSFLGHYLLTLAFLFPILVIRILRNGAGVWRATGHDGSESSMHRTIYHLHLYTLLYILAITFLSTSTSGELVSAFNYLGFLLIPIVFHAFKSDNLKYLDAFLRGALHSSLIISSYIILNFIFKGYPERVIWDSQLGALFLGIALSRFDLGRMPGRLIALLTLAFGGYAIILSGTRVSVILLYMCVMVITVLTVRRYGLKRVNKSFIIAFLLVVPLLIMIRSPLWDRFEKSLSHIGVVAINQDDQKSLDFSDSTAIRVNIFKATFSSLSAENLLLGSRDLNPYRAIENFLDPSVLELTSGQNHLHSSFLDTLVLGGLPLIIFTLYVLLRQIKAAYYVRDDSGRCVALIAVLWLFAIFFVDSVFLSLKAYLFYGVVTAIVFSNIGTKQ